MNLRPIRWAARLAVVMMFIASALWAQISYPTYTSTTVNDFAGLLSASERAELSDDLTALKRETGMEFTVVTISRLSDYGHTGAIEPFATQLFNTWGVGDADRNDGIMLLVSHLDRRLRIELGRGFPASMDRRMQAIIDADILPAFRRDDYVAGIRAGTRSIIAAVKQHPVGTAPAADSLFAQLRDRLGAWIYLALAPLLAFGTWATRLFLRLRPRRCPNDGARMYRVSEETEDAYLKPGQTTEESMDAVQHDVWLCIDCGHTQIKSYAKWFGGTGACGECGYRTLRGNSFVISQPTAHSTGQRQTNYVCQNCDHSHFRITTIPMLSNSSGSSGGGSFGGGSSSGGGASGSW